MSEYRSLADVAFNVGSWRSGREFKLQKPDDEYATKMREYEEVKARGKDFYLDLLEKGKRIREEANKL
jgi:hypothetical protein